MTTTNRGFEDQVENTTQPGVAHNQVAQVLDAAIYGNRTINFASDATLTLSVAQCDTSVMVLTDTGPVLTGPQDVEFPDAFPSMLVVNETAEDLTLKKSGETGVPLPAGESLRIASGPDDVMAATTVPGGAVTSVNGATGAVVLGGESIAEPVNVLTPSSGVVNIDCSLGDYFTLAPTANVTSITFSNLPASGKAQTIMIRFTQDSSPRTVAWPASFKWSGGVAGAVSTGSGAIDVIAITSFNQGTTWNATIAKAFA